MHYSNKNFGHASPTVLREHGLDEVAAAIDELNAASEPSHKQAESDTEGDTESSDGHDNFLDDSSMDSGSEDDEEEEKKKQMSQGEYQRLAGIGDLRGNEDGFLWFEPDEQNTQVYAELAHRTMQGRHLFCTQRWIHGHCTICYKGWR